MLRYWDNRQSQKKSFCHKISVTGRTGDCCQAAGSPRKQLSRSLFLALIKTFSLCIALSAKDISQPCNPNSRMSTNGLTCYGLDASRGNGLY